MSGYFSRIARQGGARIAGAGGPRPTTAAKTESHLAPIDHEETVMVPPRASSEVSAAKPFKPNVDVVQDQTRTRKIVKQSTPAIDPVKNSPAEAKRPAPLEAIREEVKLIEPEVTRDSSHVPPFPTPDEKKVDTLKPIESAKRIPSHSHSAETPPEKSSEKKIFEKTVEIVGGQTAEPSEVHTILLREVQEWIAAGQTATHEVIAGVADFAAEPLPDTSLPSEREPGVVRIVEGRRPKAASELVQEVSTTDFREQNFELSIGSISVVVEGDERSPAPAPAQVAAQPARHETPQRTSRLSRHYL